MAKHLVKCFYCGEQFDANTTEYVKPNARRYAHKTCAQTAEQNKSEEQKDKEALESYIKELFGVSSIPIKIAKQIQDYKENKNYTYSGIHKTLKYHYEVKGGSLEKANGGIGIVPWVYDEAFNYWRAIWEARERNEQIDITQYVLPAREVHIKPPQRQPMKHKRKLFTFLDEEEGE